MDKKLFILENEQDNILVYKLLLKDFNLVIKKDLTDALNYVESENFSSVDAAILDLNLGSTLKIGGFNVAYKIIKKNRNLPIIICSAYIEEKNVLINAKRIDATIIRKPIGENFPVIIEELIHKNKTLRISDVEQATKEFITGAAYLKYILENDFSFNSHFLEKLDAVNKIELRIIDDLNEIRELKITKKTISSNSEHRLFVETFKDNLVFYIETLIYIVESTMYSQLNIEKSEIEFIEEIVSTGHFILENISVFP